MINLYKVKDQRLISEEVILDSNSKKEENTAELRNSLWLDLIDLKPSDRHYIQETLNIELARSAELEDIEASARFFEEDGALHLHSYFYCEDEESLPDLETVAFSISPNRLVTLRARELPTFRLYRLRNRNSQDYKFSPYKILLDLLEIKSEQMADIIENASSDVERIGRNILRENSRKDESPHTTLEAVAKYEDMAQKIRNSLMDTERALSYLIRKIKLETDELEQAREILRDIDSLKPNNDYLLQRLDFLMQATLAHINIEQNKIIKIFSVVSVIFLPPTLVASIYGMNFAHMPELQSKFGYPIVLVVMLFSAIAPLLFFKSKKWL